MIRNRYGGQYITEIYGFFSQKGMGYWLLRTYGLWSQIPAHRVGGSKKLWDFRVYGLSESWVMRGSTVP